MKGTSALGADVMLGLLSSLSWSLVFLVGCPGASSFRALLSIWPSVALGVVPFVVLVRRALGDLGSLRPLFDGALLSAGPVALVAATLVARTHHRALGGVTFAIVATLVWAGAAGLVARWTQSKEREGGGLRRLFLRTAAVLSFSGVALAVALNVRSGGALGQSLVRATAGAALVAVALALPRVQAPRWLIVAGGVTWVLVVLGGLAFGGPVCAVHSARSTVGAVDGSRDGFYLSWKPLVFGPELPLHESPRHPGSCPSPPVGRVGDAAAVVVAQGRVRGASGPTRADAVCPAAGRAAG